MKLRPLAKLAALAFGIACCLGSSHEVKGATTARNDPELLAALRADPLVSACRCVRAAAWLDESYPRVTVDAERWRALDRSARLHFSARALKVAEAIYLAENAGTDQYERIFIVSRNGKMLFDYEPSTL